MRNQAALIALAAATLPACVGPLARDVQPPKTVTVVVERTVRLPAWATEQIPNPAPRDGKVRSITESNDARGAKLDYVNCRSRLIERLQSGEVVDRKACDP